MPQRPRALLIGGGVGIPPMVFLAEALRDRAAEGCRPLAMLGIRMPFPFRARPSTILVPGMPDGVIACMPLLDDWGVPSRLTTRVRLCRLPRWLSSPTLRACWLRPLDAEARGEVEIFACGPTPMLQRRRRAGARVRPALPGLAGGIHGLRRRRLRRLRGGGQTPAGPAMKRVCVDGPVFDAYTVFGRAPLISPKGLIGVSFAFRTQRASFQGELNMNIRNLRLVAALSMLGATAIALPASAADAPAAPAPAAFPMSFPPAPRRTSRPPWNPATARAEQKARDVDRKPAELLVLSGVKPGDRVVEFASFGQYFTTLLSDIVGPKGMVYMFDLPYTEARAGAASRAFVATHPNARYELVDYNMVELPQKVDVVFIVLYYHDLPLNKIDTAALNAKILKALKPGGIYFIVDHNARTRLRHARHAEAASHRPGGDQAGSHGSGLRAGGGKQAAGPRRRRSHQDGVHAGPARTHRPVDLQVPQAEEVAAHGRLRGQSAARQRTTFQFRSASSLLICSRRRLSAISAALARFALRRPASAPASSSARTTSIEASRAASVSAVSPC